MSDDALISVLSGASGFASGIRDVLLPVMVSRYQRNQELANAKELKMFELKNKPGERQLIYDENGELVNDVTGKPGQTVGTFQVKKPKLGKHIFVDAKGNITKTMDATEGSGDTITKIGQGGVADLTPAQTSVLKDLRTEFINRPEVKEFQSVSTNVNSMDSLLKSALSGNMNNKAALDQGLITMYNKLTDPNSVVRESEYARTPENLPVVNRISGAISKLKEGGAGLTDADREALVIGAKIIANERGRTYANTRDSYNKISEKYQLDPSLVTGTLPEFTAYSTDSKRINMPRLPPASGAPDSSGFVVGQQYKMKDGNMATYRGNGEFE